MMHLRRLLSPSPCRPGCTLSTICKHGGGDSTTQLSCNSNEERAFTKLLASRQPEYSLQGAPACIAGATCSSTLLTRRASTLAEPSSRARLNVALENMATANPQQEFAGQYVLLNERVQAGQGISTLHAEGVS